MKKENNKKIDDTFLAEWIAGQMKDEELIAKVGEIDFKKYQQLKHSIAGLQVVDPDMSVTYNLVRERIAKKNQRNVTASSPIYKYLSIAAILLLFIGLYQFFVFSNEAVTVNGEQRQLTFPDQSLVFLNAHSTVRYPGLFQFNRKIRLEGEAFFDVRKGSKFTVITPQGAVEVLGTKFNVNVQSDFFEVICYEGKVKVAVADQSQILTKGIAVRFTGNKVMNWEAESTDRPDWLEGETSFTQLQLKHVIEKFKQQFNCEVSLPSTVAEKEITGSFSHKNIEVALKSICFPLRLQYKFDRSGNVIIYE